MSNVIPFGNSSPQKQEKKEIFYENFVIDDQDNEIDGYWPIYEKYSNIPELSHLEASYISMIERLSTKYGWTQKPIEFFTKRLKVSRTTIYNYDLKLMKLNLLWKWEQSLGDDKGILIERVCIASAAMYYAIQRNHGYHEKAKAVHDEFIIKIKGYRKANAPIIEIKNISKVACSIKENTSQVRMFKSQDSSMNHRACSDSEHVHACSESEHVLNTTYINIHKHNNNNIERTPSSLQKKYENILSDLQNSLKTEDKIEKGLAYYDSLPEDKKKKDSPAAFITYAVKNGLADKELNKQQEIKKKEQQQQQQEKQKKLQEKEDFSQNAAKNQKLSNAIRKCFSEYPNIKVMTDHKTFRIIKEKFANLQDDDGLGYSLLPNGEKYYGNPSFSMYYDKPYEKNFKEAQNFFKIALNIQEKDFIPILSKGMQYANH